MHPHEFGLTKAAYSTNETLEVLSIGRTTLFHLVRSGELVPIRFGKKTNFAAPDLARVLNNRRGKATPIKAPREVAEVI